MVKVHALLVHHEIKNTTSGLGAGAEKKPLVICRVGHDDDLVAVAMAHDIASLARFLGVDPIAAGGCEVGKVDVALEALKFPVHGCNPYLFPTAHLYALRRYHKG